MTENNESDIPFGESAQQELEKCEDKKTLKEQLMCRDRVIMQEVGKSFRAIDNQLRNIEADIKEVKNNTRETAKILIMTNPDLQKKVQFDKVG